MRNKCGASSFFIMSRVSLGKVNTRMLQKLSIAVLLALLLGSAAAHAATSQSAAVTTFACTGNKAQRVGPCPHGGEPSFLIQGSDGNFYGTTFVSSEGNQSQPNGETVFSVTPSGQFTLLHTFLPGVKTIAGRKTNLFAPQKESGRAPGFPE
jgi:hypothetical protein